MPDCLGTAFVASPRIRKENAVIRVVRIGSLHGKCSVDWETVDGSAEAGQKRLGPQERFAGCAISDTRPVLDGIP